MIRRVIFVWALCLSCFLSAQNPAADLAFVLSEHGLEFDYAYVYSSNGMKVNGDGHIVAQNDAFRMSGNGLLLVCDGRTRWTVDEEACECYIESVNATGPDLMANPALLVLSIDRYCRNTGNSRKNFKGRSLMAYGYVADSRDVPFSSAEFFFNGNVPVGLILKLKDGSSLELEIKGYRKAGPLSIDPAQFILDADALGPDYVVTDLR